MRTGLVIALMLACPLASADRIANEDPPDPFALIARVVTARDAGHTVSARFDTKICAVHVRVSERATELDIPLRKVSWSMTTEKRGAESLIVVTARCAAKERQCITGTGASDDDPATRVKLSESRYALRFAASATEARKRFGELKKLDSHCATAPKP